MSSQPTTNIPSNKEVWPLREAPYRSEPHYATGGFISGVEPSVIPGIIDNGYVIPKPRADSVSIDTSKWGGSLTKDAIGVGDPVNHPKHYTSDPSGIECIQVTRWRNFNVGNAMKYLWRAGLKDDIGRDEMSKQIEDLQKAIWYIKDEIQRLDGIM